MPRISTTEHLNAVAAKAGTSINTITRAMAGVFPMQPISKKRIRQACLELGLECPEVCREKSEAP